MTVYLSAVVEGAAERSVRALSAELACDLPRDQAARLIMRQAVLHYCEFVGFDACAEALARYGDDLAQQAHADPHYRPPLRRGDQ